MDLRELRRLDGAFVLVTYRGDRSPWCCGELVRLRAALPRLHDSGADVVALSGEDPARAAAMARRWHLPFPVRSDPDGRRWLRALGLWDDNTLPASARPAVLVVAPHGTVVDEFRCRDDADRQDDLLVFEALDALGAAPIDPPRWTPEVPPVAEADHEAFPPALFGPYFHAVRDTAGALATRLRDEHDQIEAQRTQRMAQSFLDAWHALTER